VWTHLGSTQIIRIKLIVLKYEAEQNRAKTFLRRAPHRDYNTLPNVFVAFAVMPAAQDCCGVSFMIKKRGSKYE
jgi:hypothetical protein